MSRRSGVIAFCLFAVCATSQAFQRDTVITTGEYTIALPGVWERQTSNDDSIIFTRGDDTVYITSAALKDPSSRDEREVLVSRIANLRRKLIGDLARGKSTVSDMRGSEHAARPELDFSGEDPRNGKRFFIAVVGLSRVVITIAVYRPLLAPASDFNDTAAAILSSIR